MQTTILISSSDEFSASWKPICHGFHKYWPDCPWPLKLLTKSFKPPCGEGLEVWKTIGPKFWSGTMRRALERIKSDLILLMMSDHWITEKVDSRVMQSLASLFRNKDLNVVRLTGHSQSKVHRVYLHDKRLMMLHPKSRQRTSLQPSLWRKSSLFKLLQEHESPWDFEGRGSARSRRMKGHFLCCNRMFHPLRLTSHVDPDWNQEPIVRGRWTKSALKYIECEHLGLNVEVGDRVWKVLGLEPGDL